MKYIACCVSLFVGMFLSISQVINKERENLVFWALRRKCGISKAKIYFGVRTKRCQFSLSKLSMLIMGFKHSFFVQCCCHPSGSNY